MLSRTSCRPARRVGAFVGIVLLAWCLVTGLPLAPAAATIDASIATVPLTGPEADAADLVILGSPGAVAASAGGAADLAAPATPGWSARVPLPNDGELVGFAWNGAPEAGFELRSSSSDGGWSEWVELDAASDEGPDGVAGSEGSTVSSAGPVWVGSGTTAVEVRVVEGELADLRMDVVDVDRSATFGIDAAGAAAPFPGIEPRSLWGSPGWRPDIPGCEAGPTSVRPRYAILHHTVTTNSYSPDETYSLIRGIYEFHTNTNGWCDVAYNFFVDRFGRMIEGRSGGMDQGIIGGHARGFNTGSIGVALLGQHQPGASPASAGVSSAAIDAIRRLVAWKFALHGIDANAQIQVTSLCTGTCKFPEGVVVQLPTIVGHRDVGLTSCPGDNAIGLTSSLRPPIANDVITAGPWHPMGGWAPTVGAPPVITLDGLGGMHPAGGANTVAGGGYWSSDMARDITGNGVAGYVVDAWGAMHPYGSAPAVAASGYWPGWDIVRGIAGPPSTTQGYVLTGWGSLHPYGGAPPVFGSAYWSGWDIARDLAVLPSGLGGYVVSGWGSIHHFGTAPPLAGSAYWAGWDIARAIALNPDGPGGWVLSGWGSIHPFGGAPGLSSALYTPGADTARDLVMTSATSGYVLDRFGGVHVVGSAAQVTTSLTWTGYDLARGLAVG